jgi:hypothetical protein
MQLSFNNGNTSSPINLNLPSQQGQGQVMPNISFSNDGLTLGFSGNNSNSRYSPIDNGNSGGNMSREQLLSNLKKKAVLASNLNKIQGNLIGSIRSDISKLEGGKGSSTNNRYEPIKEESSNSRYMPIDNNSSTNNNRSSFSDSPQSGNTLNDSTINNIIFNLGGATENTGSSRYIPIS